MRIVARTIPAVALVCMPAGALSAQAHPEHGGRALERLGRVVFPTSCGREAHRRFERGVALLHSFWYEEAGRAFAAVVAVDSTCAMGYWGEAMSLLHPLWTPPTAAENRVGLDAADRAVRLARPGSREREYAEAIAAYFRGYDSVDHRRRLLAHERAMERLVQRYPRDEEARIFYALALIANGQLDVADTTYARQRRAGAILEPLFRKTPGHPGLAHYLIHAYDSPRLAPKAVGAAARYAQIAPSVPHAHHMPSHIYTRLGMWEESIAANLRSAAAARRFEASQRLRALWDQRAHALDYLAYAYLQLGRDVEAHRLLDEAKGATAVFPHNSLIAHYALAAIPARFALERERWREAAALTVRPAPAWPATEAITHFARAIGAARSGATGAARTEVEALARIEATLARAGGAQAEWVRPVRIQRLAAAAWVARAAGDTAGALRQASAAADLEDVTEKHPVTPGAVLPARELYGDLLLAFGRPAEARRAYEASLARQPNRARSLFGAARSADLAGDHAAARIRYREYLRLMTRANGNRPELTAAREAVAMR